MKNSVVTAQDLIKKLDLKPLPHEGGFYRETYRRGPTLPATSYGINSASDRDVCTAIYYLVTPEEFSALHRVKSDEMFHFYGGDPVEVFQIDDSGSLSITLMGSDILSDELPQVVVPKGVWQATRLKDGGAWALLGTTVAPGFEFEDFELGTRGAMLHLFPQYKDQIIRHTRS